MDMSSKYGPLPGRLYELLITLLWRDNVCALGYSFDKPS
jgi:hypothetical protein